MLLVDKAVGWSSFDVVAKARKALQVKRIGHAGTLDPAATGLLIVLVGREETKQQDRFMKLEKEYEVTFELGKVSTTDDAEGEITVREMDHVITRSEFEAVLQRFIGPIQQQPPIYSAIHINGERAYKLARQGKAADVVIPFRTVMIHAIQIIAMQLPFITLRVSCSHGTYIRSLVRDIGEALNCGAYVTALRRTKIGSYRVENAMSVDQITTAQNQPLTLE